MTRLYGSMRIGLAFFCIAKAVVFSAPIEKEGPLRLFLLAGGSNMQGMGISDGESFSPRPKGTLRSMVEANREEYRSLLNDRDGWAVRDDVWIWSRQGNAPAPDSEKTSMGGLGVGFGKASGQIGPEFGLGHALGDQFNDTVVVVKLAWADASLYQEFRSPLAVAKRGGTVGPCFSRMMESYQEALVEIKKKFPGREIQLMGFCWHQGEADRITELRANEYAANLEDLISDVRSTVGIPKLPVVIASTSMGDDWSPDTPTGANALAVENAQLDLDGTDDITVIYTRALYHPSSQSPISDSAHWNQNGESFYLIGNYMARKLISLYRDPAIGLDSRPKTSTSTPNEPETNLATTPNSIPPEPLATGTKSASGAASAVIHEPFAYPSGVPLKDCSGGTGFDGHWLSGELTNVAEGSIIFGALPTSGNKIGGLKAGSQFGGERKLNTKVLVAQGLLRDEASLWFSILLGYDAEATFNNSRLYFALGNNSLNKGRAKYVNDEGATPGTALGITMAKFSGKGAGKVVATHFRDKSHVDSAHGGMVFGNESDPLFANQARIAFIVGKFTWGADSDSLVIYAPNEELDLPTDPISVLVSNVDQAGFDTISWARQNGVLLDEIRFGPTFESVGGRPKR